ncbi:MAG: pseudouridine synthase [Sedimenticolaceae bacterium]
MSLKILYQDAYYVAIDKPPGLLVHRSPISRDRVFVLQTLRDQLARRVYPVHRLDRATSGVMLFGLSAEAARRMVALFEARRVDKEYLAVARGWVDDCGLIDHPVADAQGSGVAQPARTRFLRLAKVELPFMVDRYPSARYSLVSVTPETGRRQQIRKHFKHISHHLIGDTTHGNGRHNRFFRSHFGVRRLLLTSRQLAFVHPYRQTHVKIVADNDPDWRLISAIFARPLSRWPTYTCAQQSKNDADRAGGAE